jgi:hypothetical protein
MTMSAMVIMLHALWWRQAYYVHVVAGVDVIEASRVMSRSTRPRVVTRRQWCLLGLPGSWLFVTHEACSSKQAWQPSCATYVSAGRHPPRPASLLQAL